MYLIQSAHNEQLKRLSKLLKQAKVRRELGLAAMEGVHVLQAYLHTGAQPEQVFVSEKRAEHAEVAKILRPACGRGACGHRRCLEQNHRFDRGRRHHQRD